MESSFSEHELIVLNAGSHDAASRSIGSEEATLAMQSLMMRTPEEMRRVWPLVIAWCRLQYAHEQASAIMDVDTVAKIAKQQADMMRSMY